MINSHTALYALIGGLFPTLIWLHFWLAEDKIHPEPRGRIIYTFLMGAVAVIIVLPFEKIVSDNFPNAGIMAFFLWATLEECFKFGAAYITGFRTRFFDEPMDAVVYMVTAALGFSALENTFFVLSPIIQGNALDSIITTNLRFVGASLLHILASGVLGAFIAFAFYKRPAIRKMLIALGLICAIALHTLFNFFIIDNDSKYILIVFGSIWMSIIILILLIERIKLIKKNN